MTPPIPASHKRIIVSVISPEHREFTMTLNCSDARGIVVLLLSLLISSVLFFSLWLREINRMEKLQSEMIGIQLKRLVTNQLSLRAQRSNLVDNNLNDRIASLSEQ